MDRSDSASQPNRPSVPAIAHDESRLDALAQQDIFYTEPEPAFDRITRLATDLLGVPVALINFVGEDRQWFKSKVGVDERETGLDVSFCVYTIAEEGPMVVENAAQDERFAANSYVTEKGLRFYAGVPLEVEDRQPIGTLCVLDTEARSLSEEALRQLEDLAAMVEDELRLRREVARRQRSERQKEMQNTFLESIATGTAAEDVLGELCREAEREMPGSRVSILRLENGRLRHAAAPSLPPEYAAAIDGIEVGPSVATCGTAAHTGKPVVTEDIFEDERWDGYRDPVRGTRLRSCWSVPVRGAGGTVLGTFAVYGTEPTGPSAAERRLVGRMAHIASVALEHERREQALRESEERFRTVVENARPVVFMTDPDGTFVLAEGEGLEGLGLRPGEAVGESVFEVFDGCPEVTNRIRRALDGEAVEGEVDIDGTILKAWASPVHDEAGTVAGCIGMATDVTERRTQERHLEETKERYRTLVDHFPGAVFLYDETLRCVLTGGEALEAVGMRPEDIEGSTPRERYPPSIAEPLEDILRDALNGEQGVLEQSYHGRHFRIEALPIQEGATCMAVSVDITERKAAKKALKRSRERLSMALEGGNIGTWDWELETGAVVFNRQWAEMLGYSRDELDLHFSTWEDLVHPEDLPRAMEVLDEYVAGERETYNPEIRMRTKSGEWKWIQTIGKVIDRDEEGELSRAAGIHLDINERKRAEEALKERETRLRGIANSIPGVVYQFYARPDGEYGCYFISDRAEDVLGIRPDPDTFHERFTAGIPPSHRQAFLEAIEDAAEKRTPFRFEVPFESPDGETRWLVDVSSPEARGEEVVFNGVLLDVTERKEAEQARNRMTEAMEVASNGIALLDEEGTYTYMNQAHAEIFGYDAPEAFLGNTWRMCYAEAQIERFEKEFLPVLYEEGTWTGEIQGERKDGTLFPQQVTLTQLGDGGLICLAQDITERKRAERELRQSEQRFRKVFENAAIGIVIGDDEGRIRRANPAFRSMLGYANDELRGRHFSEITHPDDVSPDRDLFEELTEGKRDRYRIEKRYVRRNSEPFWGRLTASLLDLDGETTHVALVEDIDERKRYEEQLRMAKKEAEDAARLKSVMLANMSHEVRTPLTSMIGFSSLLSNRLDGKAAKLARLVQKSGQRLEETMEAVLQLSQLEAGSYTVDREPLSLPSLARRIADAFERPATEAGVSLQVETPGEAVAAYADESAVRRIIHNLLDNAIKFTPDGGTVRVRVYAEQGETVVAVEDSGVGIAADAQADVFRAFKQESEGLTREYEGAGLGLAIVQELVAVLGGTIAVDSEKGEGTRMTVRLPRPHDKAPQE